MDVKMEAIMPRIILEAKEASTLQRDRPKVMQVQLSRFAVTNIREMGASRADLAQAVHSLQEGTLVFSSGFPSKNEDLCIITDRILSHIAATDITMSSQQNHPSESYMSMNHLSRYALWNDTRDIWCIKIDPVWIDFLGMRSIGANKAIPFMDAVPITLWIHGKSQIDDEISKKIDDKNRNGQLTNENMSKPDEMVLSIASLQNKFKESSLPLDSSQINCSNETGRDRMDEKSADLHIIAQFGNLVSIQVDHYQFLFLMRLAEEINELTTFLAIDSKKIMHGQNDKSIIFGCVIPQIEVTLVMPSQTPGKESSGGDGESVIPDSISLGDDLHTTNSGWNQGSFSLDNQSRVMNTFNSIESPSPVNEKSENNAEVKANIKFNLPSDVKKDYAHNENTTVSFNVNTNSSSSSGSTVTMKSKRGSNETSIISKEINTSLIQMKKGFSSFMTSIESAVKTNASFDDGSDTISIQSDYSDDSELFTVLGDTDKGITDCNDFMFKLNPFNSDANNKMAPVEVASEVYEDPYVTNMSSPSEPSEMSCLRRRDLVSMATFR
jgi:hypothetical protein